MKQFTVVDVMFAKEEFVKEFVKQILVDQTDAVVELLISDQDYINGELTRKEIQHHLRAVKSNAHDFINDLLSDLKHSIYEELYRAQYGAIVTEIKYGIAGDVIDAKVDVTVT